MPKSDLSCNLSNRRCRYCRFWLVEFVALPLHQLGTARVIIASVVIAKVVIAKVVVTGVQVLMPVNLWTLSTTRVSAKSDPKFGIYGGITFGRHGMPSYYLVKNYMW